MQMNLNVLKRNKKKLNAKLTRERNLKMLSKVDHS